MTKRWPNTALWQRVVSTFRVTNRSRWRSAAARRLGCDKRSLRSLIDRESLPPREIKKLDAQLIEYLNDYAAWLRRRAHEADELAKAVMRAANEVSCVDLSEWDLPAGIGSVAVDELIEPTLPTPVLMALAELLEEA
jgi:hypothetical protein